MGEEDSHGGGVRAGNVMEPWSFRSLMSDSLSPASPRMFPPSAASAEQAFLLLGV